MDNSSRIADNVVLFCRTLREAGLPIGPGSLSGGVTMLVY